MDYWQHNDSYCANIKQSGCDYFNNTIPYIKIMLHHKPRARIIAGNHVLVEFNYIPNINPKNIQEKIKLFLLYS